MVKRQKLASARSSPSNSQSFNTPEIVAKPKTDRAMKRKESDVGRESTILNLEQTYIDPIRKIKLRAYDLAIVNDTTNLKKLFKDFEPKPDRMSC